MHGDHIGASLDRGSRRALHLMGNIVKLQVKKNLEAQKLEDLDDLRTLCVIQGHTHLEPLCLALEFFRKVERRLAIAVQSHDNAVGTRGAFVSC